MSRIGYETHDGEIELVNGRVFRIEEARVTIEPDLVTIDTRVGTSIFPTCNVLRISTKWDNILKVGEVLGRRKEEDGHE